MVLLLTVLCTLAAVFLYKLAPNDPNELHYDAPLIAGTEQFPLGTDNMGRCMLSRLMYGGRISVLMTWVTVLIKASVGCLIGIGAALSGKTGNNFLMRVTDLFMALPEMVCVIALIGIAGPGTFNAVFAMILIGWTRYARLSNSLTQGVMGMEYITQARFACVPQAAILFRYIIPNIYPQLLVCFTQDLGGSLLLFSSLSLLGLGPQPPVAEWGNMLSSGKKYMQTNPELMIYPGICILVFVILYNLLGDLLRDRFDLKHV